MLEWINEYDTMALLYLNGKHSPFLDEVMWWISKTITWIPLYCILLILIIYRERSYRIIFIILFVAIAVALCDQLSVLIKNLVQRHRPTHNVEIAELVHIVNDYRGGMYGFISSHAANVFGLAAFLSNQFKHYKWSIFLFSWAAVVSYSRIYLGVHYPLDIIFGAVLGILIGTQCYAYYAKTTIFLERKMQIRKEKRAAKNSR